MELTDLTDRERNIILDLYTGATMRDHFESGANIDFKDHTKSYGIDHKEFSGLVNKGLINQRFGYPYDCVLTHQAEELARKLYKSLKESS